jgi:hypothetical protein
MRGLHNDWHCTAGGRFLYICEDGLVSYCAQRRGEPGVPLEQYTTQMVVTEAAINKPCAPFCTINCVQQVSYLDSIRANPKGAIQKIVAQRRMFDPSFRPPLGLRLPNSMFVEGKGSSLWTKAAILALGLRNRKSNMRAPFLGSTQRKFPIHDRITWIRTPNFRLFHDLSAVYTGAQLEAIMTHELCHARRRNNMIVALHIVG